MKFVITRNYLDQTLGVISRGISSKTPMPVLTGVYIKAENSNLTFISTNKEISIQITIPECEELNIIEDGDCVVPGKLFSDIVKKIDDGKIEFSIFDVKTAKIISKNSNFTLTTYEKFAFPSINFNIQGPNIALSCKELRKIVTQTSFACGTAESRITLTSLNFSINQTGLTITATDSFRLSRKVCSEITVENPIQANIPSKSIEEFCKIINDSNDLVEITFANNVALFKVNNINFITRLVEGAYPDTSQLFKREKTLEVKFNRQELIQAVDRASLFVTGFSLNLVRLNFTSNSTDVVLASNSTESGRVEVTLSPIEVNPVTDLLVAFSSKNLMEALRAFEGDVVTIAFSGEIKPAVLSCDGDETLTQILFLPRPM